MTIGINNLKANLSQGGARNSLFRVFMSNPVNSASDGKVQWLCKAAAIPASTLGQIIVPYMGRDVKFAGDREFADFTVTIINDEGFDVRNALEEWSNAIQGHANNQRQFGTTGAASTYKTDLQVEQLSKTGSVLRKYRIVDAFPTEISQIDLNWETKNSIEEYTVTFAYDYWDVIGGSTGNAGGFDLGSVGNIVDSVQSATNTANRILNQLG